MTGNNLYEPVRGVIRGIIEETPEIKTFSLETDEPVEFYPGQFILLAAPGTGEAPFTPSPRPGGEPGVEVTVKRTGDITGALHRKKKGDTLGVRGPCGKGFPLEKLRNREFIIIARGRHLASVRPLILDILSSRDSYPSVTLLYGCRSPGDLLYRTDLEKWGEKFRVLKTAETPGESWNGEAGPLPGLFSRLSPEPENCSAVVAGSPEIIRSGAGALKEMGVDESRVWVPVEKRISCGFGKCRCCLAGTYYVCRDGPVFPYSRVKDLPGLWV